MLKVSVIGRLGKDVELRYTPQQMAVANFSVATSDKVKEGDDWVDKTTWLKVTVWGKTAEKCAQYLSKGSEVYLDGKFSTEEWTDKDGNNRTTLVVTANDVTFLSKKKEDGADDGSATEPEGEVKAKTAKAESKEKPEDDDIPF